MKILIVSPDLDQQTKRLTDELLKTGLEIETIEDLHPLRLMLNHYDLIHFIQPLKLKGKLPIQKNELFQLLQSFIAQTIGRPTLMSFHENLIESKLNQTLISSFQAITVGNVGELKKIKNYSGAKMILPYFPDIETKAIASKSVHESQKNINKTLNVIVPVYNSFNDLHRLSWKHIQNNEQTQIYIDARYLKKHFSSSHIRKSWQAFINKNVDFKKFILFNSNETFDDFLIKKNVVSILKHLEISDLEFSYWINSYLNFSNMLILNDEQATGFSSFWKHEKNCFIFNKNQPVQKQYSSFCEFLKSPATFNFSSTASDIFTFQQTIDLKINELTRLYTKLIQQKTSLSYQKSANMSL